MNAQQGAAIVPAMSERRVGLVGALLIAIGPVSMALFTPAMPELVRHFGTTEAAVKLTLSLYFAGFALAQLVCGPLSDGLGRKPVTYGFLLIYLIGSVVALVAPTVETLIIARFIQGVGAAVGVAISRAIVRDLFVGERSARIMNFMGIVLAAGPALAPTIGGVTMEAFGWHAIFVVMVIAAMVVVLVVRFSMVETVVRDVSRIRPAALVRAYGTLLATPYFMLSSLVMAGAIGALYTQATILPFILIDRVGLTPTEFGMGMLMQSGSFFLGSLAARPAMARVGAFRILPVGAAFIAAGSLALATLLHLYEPSFLIVMTPAALYAFGIAFMLPAMSTASLALYPHIAGAAASLAGFLQMGGGLLGGLVAAAIGDPVAAMGTVIPGMGLLSIASWLLWKRLPEPPSVGRIAP
ncbi:MAG: multidrug effflux MFS transporter [Rhizobiaceae bacterium]|nr:multidrug effflux MFS transporter [Rhizobiaceae bacterium]